MAPADATSGSTLEVAHALAAGAVALTAGVDPRIGLSTRDVEERAAEAGPNELSAPAPPKVWRLVLRSAAQPFVLMLLVAGIAAALIGEVRDGLLILAGLVPLVGADVATEYRGREVLSRRCGGICSACPGETRWARR